MATSLASLKMAAHGTRHYPVKDVLSERLREAVTAVYGPQYRAEIMSGAQPEGPRGTPGTVGSRRHGTGVAADVWVYDPSGRRLVGNELVPLAQHWLGTDVGSVGFPANGKNSLHLDLVGGKGPGSVPLRKGEGRVWYYGNPTAAERQALTASLTKGITPQYAVSPQMVAAAVQGVPIPPASLPQVATTLDTNPPPIPAAPINRTALAAIDRVVPLPATDSTRMAFANPDIAEPAPLPRFGAPGARMAALPPPLQEMQPPASAIDRPLPQAPVSSDPAALAPSPMPASAPPIPMPPIDRSALPTAPAPADEFSRITARNNAALGTPPTTPLRAPMAELPPIPAAPLKERPTSFFPGHDLPGVLGLVQSFSKAMNNARGPFNNGADNLLYNTMRGGNFNRPETATAVGTNGYLYAPKAGGGYVNVGRAPGFSLGQRSSGGGAPSFSSGGGHRFNSETNEWERDLS